MPQDNRFLIIDGVRAEADRLAAIAKHPSMQAQIRLAIQDLDEARG